MSDLTSTIDANVPTREFIDALKELDYMESHLEEYKVYHDIDKMFEDILSEE